MNPIAIVSLSVTSEVLRKDQDLWKSSSSLSFNYELIHFIKGYMEEHITILSVTKLALFAVFCGKLTLTTSELS